MKRRPEPELMDSEAQTRAYAEADFNESNSLFTEKFREYFQCLRRPGRFAGRPGLRTGRYFHPDGLSVSEAGLSPALDAGVNMLRLAEERLADEQLRGRVSFRHSYLPDPSLPAASFDALISNSLLHHLPQPQVLWQSIIQLARPGAAIQIMDLLRPDNEGRCTRPGGHLFSRCTGSAPGRFCTTLCWPPIRQGK